MFFSYFQKGSNFCYFLWQRNLSQKGSTLYWNKFFTLRDNSDRKQNENGRNGSPECVCVFVAYVHSNIYGHVRAARTEQDMRKITLQHVWTGATQISLKRSFPCPLYIPFTESYVFFKVKVTQLSQIIIS